MKKIIILLLSIVVLGGCKPLSYADEVYKAYDATLIIDPGHGGEDGGAVAADGSKESQINLDIALKMDALCDLLGCRSVMTRDSETLDYPESAHTIREKKVADQKMRVELINSVPNGILISVHQNTYPGGKPKGAQALYGTVYGSIELAEIIQSNITALIDKDNRRGAAKISDDIYLLKKANCPAVLVECGFISNEAELRLLKDSEYQLAIASVLVASYTQFISETGNLYGES